MGYFSNIDIEKKYFDRELENLSTYVNAPISKQERDRIRDKVRDNLLKVGYNGHILCRITNNLVNSFGIDAIEISKAYKLFKED